MVLTAPPVLESSHGSPTFSMCSLSFVCCAEAVQLALRCFSVGSAVSVNLMYSREGQAQCPPKLSSWIHIQNSIYLLLSFYI